LWSQTLIACRILLAFPYAPQIGQTASPADANGDLGTSAHFAYFYTLCGPPSHIPKEYGRVAAFRASPAHAGVIIAGLRTSFHALYVNFAADCTVCNGTFTVLTHNGWMAGWMVFSDRNNPQIMWECEQWTGGR